MATPKATSLRMGSVSQARRAPRAAMLDLMRAHWAPLTAGTLTLLAFALRFVLVHDAVEGDELFMLNIVDGRSFGDAMSIVRETEKTPPLFFAIVWLFSQIGDPLVWSRVPSLLLGTALVPMTYLLGVRTVGRAAAVVGAAIITLQPFAVFYATENRAYAAVAFLAALSTFALLRALESNRRAWWAGYGLAAVAVIYTHYVGVFVLIAQVLWALWTRRERLRELLIVNGLVALAFLPWLPSYLVQQDHSSDEARRIALLAPPSVEYFGKVIGRVLFGHPFLSIEQVPGRLPAALMLAVIVVAGVAAVVRAWRSRAARLPLSSPVVLLALLAIATPIGIAAISLRPNMSFMLPRNMIPSLAAAALVLGWLLVSLRLRVAIAAAALVLAVLALGANQMLDVETRRTPYHHVADFIEDRARPGDPVLHHFFRDDIAFEGTEVPLRVLPVNFERTHPFYTTPPRDEEGRAWARAERNGGHVFVVLPLPGIFEEAQAAPPRSGPEGRFQLVDQGRWDGFVDVLVGEYALPGNSR